MKTKKYHKNIAIHNLWAKTLRTRTLPAPAPTPERYCALTLRKEMILRKECNDITQEILCKRYYARDIAQAYARRKAEVDITRAYCASIRGTKDASKHSDATKNTLGMAYRRSTTSVLDLSADNSVFWANYFWMFAVLAVTSNFSWLRDLVIFKTVLFHVLISASAVPGELTERCRMIFVTRHHQSYHES